MSDFQTPKDLLNAYSNGLTGSHFDQDQTDKILSELPMPLFGEAAPDLSGSAKGKLSLPFKSVIKFDKNAYSEAQTTGDCVSMGTRNAVDVSRAVQIDIKGAPEDWLVRGASEAIYGSRGYGGAGMAGVTAAQFVHQKGGVVLRKKYGSVDLTVYDSSKGTRWGTQGIPREIIEEAIKNQVGTISLVRSLDEAADAIANGYGLAVCSNQGFSNVRDKDGFSRPQGSWSHCYLENCLVSGITNRFIQEIQSGEEVFGHDGKLHKVTKTFKHNYIGQLISIKGEGLNKFSLTVEHPVLILRKVLKSVKLPRIFVDEGGLAVRSKPITWIQETPLWVKAEDLQIGDYLLTPSININSEKIHLPEFDLGGKSVKNIPNKITEPNSELAWLFGLFIADGDSTKNHRISLTIGIKENITIKRAMKAFELLGVKAYLYEYDTYVRIRVYSAIVARAFREWFNSGAINKKIPEFLYYGWDLQSVIDGIFAGDGCLIRKSPDRFRINTISKKLAYQIFHILVSFGNHVTISCKQRKAGEAYPNSKAVWSVEWSENKVKRARFFYKNYLAHPIKILEKENYCGEVYNIEVADVNSYIAEGVATHNCMAWTACDYRESEPNFLVQQSWGFRWNSGPMGEWEMPQGAFKIHADIAARMISYGSCWAFSNVKGFPRQNLPDYGSAAYL